jgi:prephenate dehydratase
MPGVPPARYGYLGPEGTFTEAALLQVRAAMTGERIAYPSVDAALQAVREGEIAAAMVPIENSVEGGVGATLDALSVGEELVVVREALVPVRFVLAVRPGTRLEDVRRLSTHPHAQAQCRHWLGRHLPDVVYVPGLSTAAAAAGLDPTGEADPGYDATLCAAVAADRYGLQVLVDGVGDNPSAVTRFVLVSLPTPPPPPTGADKTSVVVFQADDHPGGLLELLEQFAARGINLTWIQSRPTGESLGRYSFSIDCEGHVAEARVAEALMGLHRVCTQVRFLGSYPRASGEQSPTHPSTSDRAFADSRAWLQRLLDGRA